MVFLIINIFNITNIVIIDCFVKSLFHIYKILKNKNKNGLLL